MKKQEIINCARTWVGTEFVHQGRIKKNQYTNGGCDCIGLIIGIAEELKIKSPSNKNIYLSDFDIKEYNISNTNLYAIIKTLKILKEKKFSQLVSCDLIIFKILNLAEHIAIYSEKNTIIHSIYQKHKVIEEPYTQLWKNRAFAVFSLT